MCQLRTFDYEGVALLPGTLSNQVDVARRVYGSLPNDDLLKGFRERAGLPAPGRHMGGWCAETSAVIFGQLISGMARMARATHDGALAQKSRELAAGWWRTTADGSKLRMTTYEWDKIVGGLVDLASYGQFPPAVEWLGRAVQWGAENFDRSRPVASASDPDGRGKVGTLEWYTLPENLFRCYLLTGEEPAREFGEVWLYEAFWEHFVVEGGHCGVPVVHAYSHVNSLNSAAMAYAVRGENRYLDIVAQAYDYLQETQCYVTGAYGPGERLMPADGRLGRSLTMVSDSAEVPCGTWAGFKLAKYLLCFTGEACYGDWAERLLYNSIGAALPTEPDGKTFYYADYHLPNGCKAYFWDRWPCCSGTYLQAVADYHDLIYFRNEGSLLVNLFVPSQVNWVVAGVRVTLRQDTDFPEHGETTVVLDLAVPTRFRLGFRVPAWASSFEVSVNDERVAVEPRRGWAECDRVWCSGDRVTCTMAMDLTVRPIDAAHPSRVAFSYGPVALVEDARSRPPLCPMRGTDPCGLLVPDGSGPLQFRVTHQSAPDRAPGDFLPLYRVAEGTPYRMYLDLDAAPLY
jgi:hypothetical protein